MTLLGSKRGARAGRRVNLAEIKEALSDGKVWTGIGVVFAPDGGDHYDIDADIGVLVHVELMPSGEPLMCRLGGLGEGGERGVWRIPPVGTEVAVMIPSGELDDDPILVAVLSSGGVHADLDVDTLVVSGPRIVIVVDNGSTVEIRSAGGTASPVATLADVQAIRTDLHQHTHTYLAGAAGQTAPTLTTVNPSVTAPAGTDVLLAE